MKKTIRDINVKGKKVLVRVDFNVPIDIKTKTITDDSRIKATLPTIRYLIEKRAKLILCSHLGRPGGKVVGELKLAPIANRLSELVNLPVITAPDCIGQEVEKAVAELKEGDILLLENLRFHEEEEKNEPGFAQKLAQLADIYVNDAFGTAHRTHASTVGIARFLPAVAGLLMEKELITLGHILKAPERPFCTMVGGAKVSDKLGLLHNFVNRVDSLLIGGGMSATFLKAKGYEIGNSLIEEDKIGMAREILERAAKRRTPLLLPEDVVVAESIDTTASSKVVSVANIFPGCVIVDIGPDTIGLFSTELKKAKTILWNGPVGIYEIPRFAQGTKTIASVVAGLNATTVIGGGSTVDIINEMGLAGKMTHVSTGGGASLMFLEGKTLPGVAVLMNRS